MVSMVEWRDVLYGENGLSQAIERVYELYRANVDFDAADAEGVVGVAFASDHVRGATRHMMNLSSDLASMRRAAADALFDSLD